MFKYQVLNNNLDDNNSKSILDEKQEQIKLVKHEQLIQRLLKGTKSTVNKSNNKKTVQNNKLNTLNYNSQNKTINNSNISANNIDKSTNNLSKLINYY